MNDKNNINNTKNKIIRKIQKIYNEKVNTKLETVNYVFRRTPLGFPVLPFEPLFFIVTTN